MSKFVAIFTILLSVFLLSTQKVAAQGVAPGPTRCMSLSAAGAPGGGFNINVVNTCAYTVSSDVCVAPTANVCPGAPQLTQTVTLTSFGHQSISDPATLFFASIQECPPDFASQNGGICMPANSPLASAILPNSAISQIGGASGLPTVFATVANNSNVTLSNCIVDAFQEGSPTFFIIYQKTNPATNMPTGPTNTAFSIPPNGSQSLVLTFQSGTAFSSQIFPVFSCSSTSFPAAVNPGVNTVDLTFTTTPTADITALAETASNNGVLSISLASSPQGAFAVATTNSGISETITVKPAITPSSLLASALVCQTDPSTGACLTPPATSVSPLITIDATPTFSVFVTASERIPLDPSANRVSLKFTDPSGFLVGSTSVALTAQ